MPLRLKVEYINGSLQPLEPLELEPGTVVALYIEDESRIKQERHSVLEVADRIQESAPAEVWEKLPTDGAQNVKHYLYGHPKKLG